MADTKMALPLQNEMQLAQWISGMISGKTANPNYKGEVAKVNQIAPLGSADLQNLMTEFMRGQGGFLQNMMQQNQSGLYNTNTRRLVADDITAQAALKATAANTDIAKANAQLANTYQAQVHASGPKYLPGNPRGDALGGLAIAGLSKLLSGGLSDFLGGGVKPNKKKEGSTSAEERDAFNVENPLGVALESAATGFLGEGLSGNILGETADSFGAGISMPDMGGFDLGSSFSSSGLDLGGLGEAVSNFSVPDFELPDFNLGDFDLGDTFDFLDVGSWFN